jgi:hypothetical protein
MLECAGALRVAAEDPTLRRVFLFVDFFSFNARPRFANDYEESRLNPDLVLVEYWSGNLFGLRSIGAAVDVLERARAKELPAIDELGYRRQESSAVVGATEAFEVVIENFVTDPGLYGSWTLGEEQVGSFREAVALCRERDLELVVAVLPVHATLLETLRGLGLWEARKDWLRTLVTVLEQEGGPTLWDFTSYTGTATEPVTTAGNRRRAAWFRDASHMTSKLGTLVLRDLLRPDLDAAELGRRVDSANLDEHFERIESDRREYLRYQSDDVAFVRGLLERIRGD